MRFFYITERFFLLIILLFSERTFSQKDSIFGEPRFTIAKERATLFTSYDNELQVKFKDSLDLCYMMPPAGNQGTKAACWAWATTYVLRSVMDKGSFLLPNGQLDPKKVYSPEYVYQYYKGKQKCEDFEAYSFMMLDSILKNGVIREFDLPYNKYQCTIPLTQTYKTKAQMNRMPGYTVEVIHDLVSIKTAISKRQPLVISIMFDNKFRTSVTSKSPFWSSFDAVEYKGTHALVVVGYNDRLKAIKVLNSWGKEWGDNGYAWISYKLLKYPTMNYGCYPKMIPESSTLTEASEVKPEEDSEDRITYGEVTWAKEGYFRPYEKFKVVVSKLSRKNHFAVIEIRSNEYDLITNFYVDEKSSKEFYIDNDKFRFTFNVISGAGRNPFTKAAYYTITQYPKP